MNPPALLGLVVSGLAGGLIGIRLRLPLGGLIGSIAGAGAFQLVVGGAPSSSPVFRLAAQLLVGTIVGASVSRAVLATLRRLLLPALLFCMVMPLVGLATGWLLVSRLGHVDILTGFLSAAPAGAMEMSTAALAFDADAEVVLTAHVLRVVTIAFLGGTVLPIAVRRRRKPDVTAGRAAEPAAAREAGVCTPARTDHCGQPDRAPSSERSGRDGT